MIKYEKVYVSVEIKVDTQGYENLLSLEWEDGRIFFIDKTLSERMSPPAHVGAVLTKRYDVVIEGRERTLYHETTTNRWFVEKPLII